MEKYYKNYLLKDEDELKQSDLSNQSIYVKAYFLEDLGCVISERINAGVIDWVVYYSAEPHQKHIAHQKDNYEATPLFSFYIEKKSGFILKNYVNNELVSYLIKSYDENNNPTITQEFNDKFELIEYRSSVYKNNLLIEEKLFYSDSWVIHIEPI